MSSKQWSTMRLKCEESVRVRAGPSLDATSTELCPLVIPFHLLSTQLYSPATAQTRPRNRLLTEITEFSNWSARSRSPFAQLCSEKGQAKLFCLQQIQLIRTTYSQITKRRDLPGTHQSSNRRLQCAEGPRSARCHRERSQRALLTLLLVWQVSQAFQDGLLSHWSVLGDDGRGILGRDVEQVEDLIRAERGEIRVLLGDD